ncbi:hypothetical protein QE152_g22570 [Popillia japonica]|uniref:Uncharacterized protein n=1 Tax=Popillia japonica TaxID=7064 RepID=A0AAW1KK80_POPJA
MSTSNKKASNKDGYIRLKIKENMIEKPADVATAFNEFFITEPKRISSPLQKCTQTVLPETTKVSNSMSAFPFSESEMLDVINQIKKKKVQVLTKSHFL